MKAATFNSAEAISVKESHSAQRALWSTVAVDTAMTRASLRILLSFD